MIGISGTVIINGNRGRATLQCVQSIHRVDAQLGRNLDINSAWRDPIVQERLYNEYRAYVNGNGPWAPIALRPEDSVHCKGEAIDSDDGYNANIVRVLNDHGWFHTVYRYENGVRVLKEPWHFEYTYSKDNHRFEPVPAGSEGTPVTPPKEWDEMATEQQVEAAAERAAEKAIRRVLAERGSENRGGSPTPIKSANGSLALIGEFSAQVLQWPRDAELWKAALWASGYRGGDVPAGDVLADSHFDLLVANATSNGANHGIN